MDKKRRTCTRTRFNGGLNHFDLLPPFVSRRMARYLLIELVVIVNAYERNRLIPGRSVADQGAQFIWVLNTHSLGLNGGWIGISVITIVILEGITAKEADVAIPLDVICTTKVAHHWRLFVALTEFVHVIFGAAADPFFLITSPTRRRALRQQLLIVLLTIAAGRPLLILLSFLLLLLLDGEYFKDIYVIFMSLLHLVAYFHADVLYL